MEENKEPVVQVRNLTKVFRDFWHRPKVRAVDHLDLDIHAGEVFGLLGPNGSGKSTTIKILLGLLHPTSGDVRVLGASPRDVSTKAYVGYLPEESYLYQYLSPRETLDFYGRLFNLDSHSRRQRVSQLLDMVGLSHVAHRPVGEFSKGMARRVGLAQALINDPRLIILDEPTSGLDPIGCRQVKDLMQTLSARGKTIILSSHLLADIEDVCDRIAILYNGRIQAQGRVRELLEKPDHMTVTVPTLDPAQQEKILDMLKDQFGIPGILGRPSMNLEQFFLRVVEQANASNSRPSGAAHSLRVADYIRGETGSLEKKDIPPGK